MTTEPASSGQTCLNPKCVALIVSVVADRVRSFPPRTQIKPGSKRFLRKGPSANPIGLCIRAFRTMQLPQFLLPPGVWSAHRSSGWGSRNVLSVCGVCTFEMGQGSPAVLHLSNRAVSCRDCPPFVPQSGRLASSSASATCRFRSLLRCFGCFCCFRFSPGHACRTSFQSRSVGVSKSLLSVRSPHHAGTGLIRQSLECNSA